MLVLLDMPAMTLTLAALLLFLEEQWAWCALICTLLVCLHWPLAAAVHAQNATGEVQGTVVDQSGAILPGVSIAITNTATGATREAVTDAGGLFAIPGLPIGPYEVMGRCRGSRRGDSPTCACRSAR